MSVEGNAGWVITLGLAFAFAGTTTAGAGGWETRPYSLLADGKVPKVAVAVACLRYPLPSRLQGAGGIWVPPQGSAEAFAATVVQQAHIPGEVRLLARFAGGFRNLFLLETRRDTGERHLDQILVHEDGKGGFAVTTELRLDDLFLQALSGHPYLDDPWRKDYPAASTSGMEVWPDLAEGSPVRLFLVLDAPRHVTFDKALSTSPHLARLVEVAGTGHPGGTTTPPGPVLARRTELASSGMLGALIHKTLRPERLRVLRQISGPDWAICFIMNAEASAVDGAIEVWPFVREGSEWCIAPGLFPSVPDAPPAHLVVNALLQGSALPRAVRELTLATPPVVEWGPMGTPGSSGAGVLELPLVLSWPARTAAWVRVATIGGDPRPGITIRQPVVSFAPGETRQTVRVEVSPQAPAHDVEVVVAEAGGGCDLGSRVKLTVPVGRARE